MKLRQLFFNYELVKFSKARKARGGSDLFQGIKKKKDQNFQKSLCILRDTPTRYIRSKFGVSRSFLAPESTFGVFLRYCAICVIYVQNPFLSIFSQNQVKIFILAINSSTNCSFIAYFSNIYHDLLKNHKKQENKII